MIKPTAATIRPPESQPPDKAAIDSSPSPDSAAISGVPMWPISAKAPGTARKRKSAPTAPPKAEAERAAPMARPASPFRVIA